MLLVKINNFINYSYSLSIYLFIDTLFGLSDLEELWFLHPYIYSSLYGSVNRAYICVIVSGKGEVNKSMFSVRMNHDKYNSTISLEK